MTLSVVIITYNEELNLARTLKSVVPLVADGKGEIIVVDSGSTDRTVEIARSFGAKVFVEDWKGFAAQKNSAIDKASGDWILSLDADEEVSPVAQNFILDFLLGSFGRDWQQFNGGILFARHNYFLGRWIKHGGFYPDRKIRLLRRTVGQFEPRLVHEDIKIKPGQPTFDPSLHYSVHGDNDIHLIHHSYPTLSDYIEHMNRYSSLGAEMVVSKANSHFSQSRREVGHPANSHPVGFSFVNIVLRPLATFLYNYFFRLGFLDGREGLLLHLYHAVYVSWKYAKAWELSRNAAKPLRPATARLHLDNTRNV